MGQVEFDVKRKLKIILAFVFKVCCCWRGSEEGRTMAKFQVRLLLTVDDEAGATNADVAEYVRDLEWAGGCRHPEDPMSNHKKVTHVEVRRGGKKKAAPRA